MAKFKGKLLIGATITSLGMSLGCTKTTPEFGVLDSSRIPQPLFSGSTSGTLKITDPNQNILISGTCDARVTALSFRRPGLTGWVTAESLAVPSSSSQDCGGTGTFSFSLPSLVAQSFDITQSLSFTVEARAMTLAGESHVSQLVVSYSPQMNIKLGSFQVTSASGKATGSSVMAMGRVTTKGLLSAPSAAGSTVQILRTTD